MNSNEEGKIDPSQYKGILPAHMRQGIPPYLQILFAARPKLPFLPKISKPHQIKVQGFFGEVDYKRLLHLSEEAKKKSEVIKAEEKIPEASQKTFQTALVKKNKILSWKEKMNQHLERQGDEYLRWLEEKNLNSGNKSKDPKNTLIVFKLVNL